MAKLVVVCPRGEGADDSRVKRAVSRACGVMIPSHIVANAPAMGTWKGVYWGVGNPTGHVSSSESHVLVGTLLDMDPPLLSPGGRRPDGSFALVRFDHSVLELVSDVVASRTIWYYVDDTVMIVSTSQRAIISLLGSFDFNEAVVPWYLSSGSLGPSASWDRRIKRLPPSSTLRLSRRDWTVRVLTEELQFELDSAPKAEHSARLREAIFTTLAKLELPWARWMLPLSGGGDSRVLLKALSDLGALEQGLQTVTWGAAKARNQEGNDANVAQAVAGRFGAPNIYLSNDADDVDAEVAVERYIRAGEARVDHVAAYTDGMGTWADLFSRGIQGTIRGDQAFGLPQVSNELDARLRARLILFQDVGNLKQFKALDWPEQKVPEDLLRKSNETLEQWRDRLSLLFRVPTFLAALSDNKLGYSEQVNPFLSELVIREVLLTPDDWRTSKKLFKGIAAEVMPDIPFAIKGANTPAESWLAGRDLVELIMDGLQSASAEGTVPREFAAALRSRTRKGAEARMPFARRVRRTAKRFLPSSTLASLRSRGVSPFIDWSILSLRVHLMTQTRHVLAGDARSGSVWLG